MDKVNPKPITKVTLEKLELIKQWKTAREQVPTLSEFAAMIGVSPRTVWWYAKDMTVEPEVEGAA